MQKYRGELIKSLKISGSKKYKVGKEKPIPIPKIPPTEPTVWINAISLFVSFFVFGILRILKIILLKRTIAGAIHGPTIVTIET